MPKFFKCDTCECSYNNDRSLRKHYNKNESHRRAKHPSQVSLKYLAFGKSISSSPVNFFQRKEKTLQYKFTRITLCDWTKLWKDFINYSSQTNYWQKPIKKRFSLLDWSELFEPDHQVARIHEAVIVNLLFLVYKLNSSYLVHS